MHKPLLITTLTLALGCSAAYAKDIATSLTIYSKMGPGAVSPELYRPGPGQGFVRHNTIPGYAVVRQERDVNLPNKRTEVRLDNIAAYIDPTTVTFKSLTDGKHTNILEQNYMFDLVSPQKLAERYLGETIRYEKHVTEDTAPEERSGVLLSVQDNRLTVQHEDGSIVSVEPGQAVFPKLPGQLFTKPTLMWDVVTATTGTHRAETSYQTEGITWWADYNAVYREGRDANNGFLDLGAWVSIVNKSGASYEDAQLKLIAGDVHRAPNAVMPQRAYAAKAMMMEDAAAVPPGFSEKSFFEFHLYTLGRPTTIPDNTTKQVELFPQAVNIPVVKELVYYGSQPYRYYGGINYNTDYGSQTDAKVAVYLKFRNDEKQGMGMPMPAGRLRVSKRDMAGQSLEFIGEDTIDHTPANEEVAIKMGNAFDVVGTRKQEDFFADRARKVMEEEITISLRNHKKEAVTVIAKENLYRATNWEILRSSHDYTKEDAFSVAFKPKVKAGGEEVVRYRVRYSWR